ncbi:MAG: hypothetical protein AAGF79_19805 [Pseudomonadota bacterium]
MSYDTHLAHATRALRAAMTEVREELRAYPTPVSGCDVQYNHLIGTRNAVSLALKALETPPFVATPRTSFPEAGVESR